MSSHLPDGPPSIPKRLTGAVATGCTLQPLNASVIAISVVAVVSQFGPSLALDWLIPVVYMATAVGAPLAGRLGSILGARNVYLAGLAVVTTGSLLGASASDPVAVVAAYGVIGVGMAAQLPNAMTMIREYGDRRGLRSKSSVTALAACTQGVAALSPMIGGICIDALGWRSVLWLNLPVVAVSSAFVLHVIPKHFVAREQTPAWRKLDLTGNCLFVIAIVSMVTFLMSIGQFDQSWFALPPAVVSTMLFVWRERRCEFPMMDVSAMTSNRTLHFTFSRTFVTFAAIYCAFFGIPQWLQYNFGMSAGEAGAAMLPMAASGVLSTLSASRAYQRYGPRTPLLIGTAFLLAGGTSMTVLAVMSSPPHWLILVTAAAIGVPLGSNNISNQCIINNSTNEYTVGSTIGTYRTVQYIGAAVAVGILHSTGGSLTDNNAMFGSGVVIATLSVVLLVELNLPLRFRTY